MDEFVGSREKDVSDNEAEWHAGPGGSLFIIGGGLRPVSMMKSKPSHFFTRRTKAKSIPSRFFLITTIQQT
jgi:hypothetical protein